MKKCILYLIKRHGIQLPFVGLAMILAYFSLGRIFLGVDMPLLTLILMGVEIGISVMLGKNDSNNMLTLSQPFSRENLWKIRYTYANTVFLLLVWIVAVKNYTHPIAMYQEFFIVFVGYAAASMSYRSSWYLFYILLPGLAFAILDNVCLYKLNYSYSDIVDGNNPYFRNVFCVLTIAMFILSFLLWKKEKKIFVRGGL